MELSKLQQALSVLDQYEALGMRHRLTKGVNLNYSQYLYLTSRPNSGNILEELYTPAAIATQERIRTDFHTKYSSGILTAQDFFRDDKGLEIEKLLRYIDIPPHQHDFLECAYVVTGSCLHKINDREYIQEAGSFVAIPFGITHSLYPTEDCLCITIKIRGETLLKMQFPDMVHIVYPQAFPCGDDAFVKNTILSIYEQQEENLPYCDQIMEQLFQVLMFYIVQRYHEEAQFLITDNMQNAKMVEILSFMMDNYQTITLRSVADHFHYNAAYLSRLFHEQAGKPFSMVLKEFKLRQAAQLLVETDHKLNDICDEVGYRDTTQFIRSFKELYGTTPIQYRKQMSKTK